MEMEELKNKYSFSDGLMEKIKHSIEVLRKGEEFALRFYDKGYYLAFSGGKDSQALYHIAKLAGVKFEAHMNMTTVDPANVVSFVRMRSEPVKESMIYHSISLMSIRKRWSLVLVERIR